MSRRRRRGCPRRGKRCWRSALARTPSPPWPTGRTRARAGRRPEAQPGTTDSEGRRASRRTPLDSEPARPSVRLMLWLRASRSGANCAASSRVDWWFTVWPAVWMSRKRLSLRSAAEAAEVPQRKSKPSPPSGEPYTPMLLPVNRFRNTTAPRVKLRRRLPLPIVARAKNLIAAMAADVIAVARDRGGRGPW